MLNSITETYALITVGVGQLPHPPKYPALTQVLDDPLNAVPAGNHKGEPVLPIEQAMPLMVIGVVLENVQFAVV